MGSSLKCPKEELHHLEFTLLKNKPLFNLIYQIQNLNDNSIPDLYCLLQNITYHVFRRMSSYSDVPLICFLCACDGVAQILIAQYVTVRCDYGEPEWIVCYISKAAVESEHSAHFNVILHELERVPSMAYIPCGADSSAR